LLRLFVEETRQLLEARSAAKRMTRSATQTVIQPRDNNPLKFSPTTDEALRILFGPPRPTYLDARGAFAQAFLDLKTHQVRSYAAMQQAVRLLGEDLDPVEIDKSVSEDGGLAKLVGSRKGRLWDAYVSRWDAKNRRSDDRLVDAFMRYYADCYDRSNAGK
jgi:type VI secretion system protein ImpI